MSQPGTRFLFVSPSQDLTERNLWKQTRLGSLPGEPFFAGVGFETGWDARTGSIEPSVFFLHYGSCESSGQDGHEISFLK